MPAVAASFLRCWALQFWPLEPAVNRGQARADASCYAIINATGVKLPELWMGWIRSWFAQMEAQFATKGVSMSLT